MQPLSPACERIAPAVIDGPGKGLNPVNTFYTSIESWAENKVQMLWEREAGCIGE